MKTQREHLLGAAASTATKIAVGKGVTCIGTKVIQLGHPSLLVGDAVELGSRFVCDSYGLEDSTAEAVALAGGAGATTLVGASLGSVGGPVGAIIGAGSGFGFWCVGKVASELVCLAVECISE